MMNEKRFEIVKGIDNNVNKKAYFIQDTYKGHILGGSYWKEEWAKEDCNLLNCALCRQEKTIEALEKENVEIHHSKILANGFIIHKGLEKEYIEWSKENE